MLEKWVFRKIVDLKSEIIAFEIDSRHKRSIKKIESISKTQKLNNLYNTVYKVFIHYIPNENSVKSIKGYVCSCSSGLRVIGCCVHVASVICFLSNFKYKQLIKLPGEHLNSIFINSKLLDLPNKPRYVRLKRKPKQLVFLPLMFMSK